MSKSTYFKISMFIILVTFFLLAVALFSKLVGAG